jgi:hypothetical protein
MTPNTYWKYDTVYRILLGERDRRDHMQDAESENKTNISFACSSFSAWISVAGCCKFRNKTASIRRDFSHGVIYSDILSSSLFTLQ